MLTVDEV
jgi:hypothetical protein